MTENKQILVVEDEVPLLEVITRSLGNVGYKVKQARGIPEAKALLENNEIDGIWLDHYLLGQENGLDLVTDLKSEDSKWRDIPIFVVSNTASPDKVQSYLGLGVDKYYTKSDSRLDEIIDKFSEYLVEAKDHD